MPDLKLASFASLGLLRNVARHGTIRTRRGTPGRPRSDEHRDMAPGNSICRFCIPSSHQASTRTPTATEGAFASYFVEGSRKGVCEKGADPRRTGQLETKVDQGLRTELFLWNYRVYCEDAEKKTAHESRRW